MTGRQIGVLINRKGQIEYVMVGTAKGIELPGDILLVSPTVSPEVVEIVRKTFAEQGDALLAALTQTEENAKYIGGAFGADVVDADYDVIRVMFANVGVTEFSEFVGE